MKRQRDLKIKDFSNIPELPDDCIDEAMPKKQKFAVLSLNPGIDRALYLPSPMEAGSLNRAARSVTTQGSKGANVAIMLHRLGNTAISASRGVGTHKEVQRLSAWVVPIVARVGDLHDIRFKPAYRMGKELNALSICLIVKALAVLCGVNRSLPSCPFQIGGEERNTEPIKHILIGHYIAKSCLF